MGKNPKLVKSVFSRHNFSQYKFTFCFGLSPREDKLEERNALYLIFYAIRMCRIDLLKQCLYPIVLRSAVQLDVSSKTYITPLYFAVMEYLYFVSVADSLKNADVILNKLLQICSILYQKKAEWHPCGSKGFLSTHFLKAELRDCGLVKESTQKIIDWIKKLSAVSKKYFDKEIRSYKVNTKNFWCTSCWITCPHYPL